MHKSSPQGGKDCGGGRRPRGGKRPNSGRPPNALKVGNAPGQQKLPFAARRHSATAPDEGAPRGEAAAGAQGQAQRPGARGVAVSGGSRAGPPPRDGTASAATSGCAGPPPRAGDACAAAGGGVGLLPRACASGVAVAGSVGLPPCAGAAGGAGRAAAAPPQRVLAGSAAMSGQIARSREDWRLGQRESSTGGGLGACADFEPALDGAAGLGASSTSLPTATKSVCATAAASGPRQPVASPPAPPTPTTTTSPTLASSQSIVPQTQPVVAGASAGSASALRGTPPSPLRPGVLRGGDRDAIGHLLDLPDPQGGGGGSDEDEDDGAGDDCLLLPGIDTRDASIPGSSGWQPDTGRERTPSSSRTAPSAGGTSAATASSSERTAPAGEAGRSGLGGGTQGGGEADHYENAAASYLHEVKAKLVKDPKFLSRHKSFVIAPPDPIATQNWLKPSDLTLPRVLVYLPFDLRGSYQCRCPHCGSRNVVSNGYSSFRRVIDLDECLFTITRRYECRAGHRDGKYFHAWDSRLLQDAPPYVRLSFPVVLTHRLAVTQAVADTMRTMMVNGMGVEQFTDFMKEAQTRRHHRKELAYMSRLAELINDGEVGSERVAAATAQAARSFPRFSKFDDPLGYNGCYGSKTFYRQLYARIMEELEEPMKKRSSMIPATMLSGDHFFKILKSTFTFNGKKLFTAAYSLVNEHTEVMSIVLTQSKTLEELRGMLESVQQRMVALGLSPLQVEVFFSDNPTAEAGFLESVFPGLKRTAAVGTGVASDGAADRTYLPKLSIPAGHTVIYAVSTVDAERLLLAFRMELSQEPGPSVVGLDAEWNVSSGAARRGPSRVHTLQLSSATQTLILHLSRFRTMPSQLRILLGDVTVTKVGKNIGGDKAKLLSSYGLKVLSTLELGRLAKDRQLVADGVVGLAALTEALLKCSLDKGELVRFSDWSRPLSEEQLQYAALDAFASLAVYRAVMLAGSPIPPLDSDLLGLDLYLMNECGKRRVARCKVADQQPAKHGNFQVAEQQRVWVEITEVLVPGYAKPFSIRREPKKLEDMVNDAKKMGTRPVMVVCRRHLRDANHPVEVPDAIEQQRRLPVPAVEPGDGAIDALPQIAAASRICGGTRGPEGPTGGSGGPSGLADAARGDGGGPPDRRADDDQLSLSTDSEVDDILVLDDGDDEDGAEEEAEEAAVRDGGDGGDVQVVATQDSLRCQPGQFSGVKGDVMHWMDRLLRLLPKHHGAIQLFSICLSHALMLYNDKDLEMAKRVAAEKWPEMTWEAVLYRKSEWINKRVRRLVPSPSVIVPRVKQVIADFQDVIDAKTQQPLFSAAARKAAEQGIKMAGDGWLSDPPGVPLYVLRSRDRDNLPLWLCSRGTNSNEGTVHQKAVKIFHGFQGASAELIHYVLLEWVHRLNMRSARNNRVGVTAVELGHWDTWLLDEILLMQERVFGERVSHFGHQRAGEYELPDFFCGVTAFSPELLDRCALPHGEALEQMKKVIPVLSDQERWLAKVFGAQLPFLPVHTKEEKIVYHEVQRDLKQQLGRVPDDDELAAEFNRWVGTEWGNLVQAATRRTAAGVLKVTKPTLYFKTPSHMGMYQAFFDRSTNRADTMLLARPGQLQRNIAGAAVSSFPSLDDAALLPTVVASAVVASRGAAQPAPGPVPLRVIVPGARLQRPSRLPPSRIERRLAPAAAARASCPSLPFDWVQPATPGVPLPRAATDEELAGASCAPSQMSARGGGMADRPAHRGGRSSYARRGTASGDTTTLARPVPVLLPRPVPLPLHSQHGQALGRDQAQAGDAAAVGPATAGTVPRAAAWPTAPTLSPGLAAGTPRPHTYPARQANADAVGGAGAAQTTAAVPVSPPRSRRGGPRPNSGRKRKMPPG